MRLGQWHLVNQLLKDITGYQGHAEIVEFAVDLLLSNAECPTDTLLEALQVIIKDVVYSHKSGLATTAKWVRVLMSLTLPSREHICEEAMTQLKERLAIPNVRLLHIA